MKSRAEYFREYRAKKGDATIHAKVDLLIEMVEQLLGGKKIVLPATLPKPVVRPEPMQSIGKSAEICCRCGAPPFYKDDKGIYCSQHSTRDSKPI